MIERIEYNSKEYAVVIRKEHHEEGVHFLTSAEYSQQLAYMHHTKGKNIDAHIHNREIRNVEYTQEVLIIRKGKLRVDFYDDEQKYIESILLDEGDVILLVTGGHGFKVLEEVEMIEVKQGPYLGENDKLRFENIEDNKVIMR